MIRVGTFNLNNLFDRFNFHAAVTESPRVRATYRWRLDASRDLLPPPEDGSLTDEEDAVLIEGESPVHIELSPQGRVVRPKPSRQLEALLTRTDRLNSDVLAVQEVENIAALREFNSRLDAPYQFVVLIEGNDPRFIDVGVLSRLPIGSAISHRWFPDPINPNRYLFSRDVIAVKILNHARTAEMFTLWVGHLKSKFVDPRITDPVETAAENQRNDSKRTRQAQAMHDIIEAHHSAADSFVVCGDFNDHPDSATLSPLIRGNINIRDVLHGGVQVDFERPEGEGPRISNPQDQPADEDWTHRLSVSNGQDIYERFDQILLSPSLQSTQVGARIQRRTHWGKNNAGTDHDPLYVDLNLNP
jgi:predicted extracellular nuclease